MKIYLARPISGCTREQVLGYYDRASKVLRAAGYQILSPMKGKAHLRTEKRYRPKDYRHPIATNHSIFHRDRWMVGQADVVYTNLIGAQAVSIGSMMELAWANEFNKYVVVSMEPDNPHQHAFVLEAAHTVFETHQEALDYLIDFIE